MFLLFRVQKYPNNILMMFIQDIKKTLPCQLWLPITPRCHFTASLLVFKIVVKQDVMLHTVKSFR